MNDDKNNIFSIITSTIIETTIAIHRRNTFFLLSKMIGNTVNEEVDMLNIYDHNIVFRKIFLENIKKYDIVHNLLYEGIDDDITLNNNGSVNIVVSGLLGRKNYSVGHTTGVIVSVFLRQPPDVNKEYRYKDIFATAIISFGNTVEMIYSADNDNVSYFWFNNKNGFHSYTIDLKKPHYNDIISVNARKLPKFVKDKVDLLEENVKNYEYQLNANFLIDLFIILRRGGIFFRGGERRMKYLFYIMPVEFLINKWGVKLLDGKGNNLIDEDFVVNEEMRNLESDVFLELTSMEYNGKISEQERMFLDSSLLENSVVELIKITREDVDGEKK